MDPKGRRRPAAIPPQLEADFARSLVEENNKNLPIAALAAIGIFSLYLLQLRFAPGLDPAEHPKIIAAYALCYSAFIALSALFLAWDRLAARGGSGRAVGWVQTAYVASLLIAAACLTSIDLLRERDYSGLGFASMALALAWRAKARRYAPLLGAAPFACLAFSVLGGVPLSADLALPIFVSCLLALVAARILESSRKSSFLMQAELREQSTRDPLTGLRNRRFLVESMDLVLAGARRNGFPLGILIIDIDHFKDVNDEKGHPVGDLVLQTIAGELIAALRCCDLVVRFGGEEFLAVLVDTGLEGGYVVAERIRERIAALELPELGRQVTVSCGLAELAADESFECGVTRADAKLYAAKREGRNRTER
jgi:diguanylate cyclase (GGDEF)-like protein